MTCNPLSATLVVTMEDDMTSISNMEWMDRLTDILETMDVPHARRQDKAWLRRNLAVRNSKHKDFKLAMELLR